MSVEGSNDPEAKRREIWQRKLLPFMVVSIVLMGLFFFVASIVQLYYLHHRVTYAGTDLRPIFEEYEKNVRSSQAHSHLEYLQWKMLVLLEQDGIARRYHQVNSAMLARIWTRYLGFVTGMILSLVGAVFILGKLREEPTKLETESQILKTSLYTSSPGIVLSVLGTALMAITLVVPFELKTTDAAVFLKKPTMIQEERHPDVWPDQEPNDERTKIKEPSFDSKTREKELFPDSNPAQKN